ncbi:MAG: TRAP transporter permease [Alphaproteobacteria bacterium]|nr:TRAP transporter permease [Alphaproteobacteria bacterium]
MTNTRPLDKFLPDIIKEVNSGTRKPSVSWTKTITFLTFAWSFFQLWYASPLPFSLGFFILNDTEARAIHLGFALLLAFLVYPAYKESSRYKIPIVDIILAVLGCLSALYLYVFYIDLSERPGMPRVTDIIMSIIGIIVLLEAARRCLGMPLMLIASIALFYIFAGQFMPEVIAHKGASINKAFSYQWLTTEGVFGIALGVSTSFVFLFVLFGSLLDKAGAGGYFIKLAFSMLGHYRGGPAKAAVLSSGLTGLISGSSVANVVTTGTFTIPLMKKVGFSGEQAGAIEAATGINGQILPPVMGAAAFIMVEYVGISYGDVCKHALLPAIISYIALLYMVHLDAVSAGMKGIPKAITSTFKQALFSFGITLSSFIILGAIIYFGLGWVKDLFGSNAVYVLFGALIFVYIGTLYLASKYTDINSDKGEIELEEMKTLPPLGPTFKAGIHFLLPIVVLIWCLIVERLSPGLSAFWAIVFLLITMVTQRPITIFFKKTGDMKEAFLRGFSDIKQGMIAGARNMIAIGIATATAGIVVGMIALTGVGLKMTSLIELISSGNVFLMFAFTAIISLLVGMGLPTTANYIVVSSLMAPVLVELGAMNGMIIPLIAVHLFVFYFGIMADVTPPVGLASFAAAAVAGSDPLRTGIKATFYSLRTVVLPFFFVFNPQLLLIKTSNPHIVVFTILSAIIGMMAFVASIKGYFLVKSKWYENIILLLSALIFFMPNVLLDQFTERYKQIDPYTIPQFLESKPHKGTIKLRIEGENISGDKIEKSISLRLSEDGAGYERLEKSGLKLRYDKDAVRIEQVEFGSNAANAGLSFDWTVKYAFTRSGRISKEWLFIPALLLIGFVVFFQRRRQRNIRDA